MRGKSNSKRRRANYEKKITHSFHEMCIRDRISAMSREELDKVAEKLRPFLKEVLGEKRIDMVYVMLTDILEESSRVIFEGHDAGRILADAFEREENENGILLEGSISRKKQLIPTLMNAMAEKV